MTKTTPGQAAFAQTVQASPWTIVLVGMLALAAAMGIGRFAFTPLLPMMLNDGVIDLPGASWLASANYLGHLLGALLCTFQPLIWQRFPGLPAVAAPTWARAGLVATCVFTLGMALHLPWLWPVLRFAAGAASAVVFVFTSGWCLGQLAARNAGALGAAIYAGPGAGIVLSGLIASGMVAAGWSASSGWLVFGVLTIILTAMVWRTFQQQAEKKQSLQATATQVVAASELFHQQASLQEMLVLALTYGLAGFGYIITATFLPVIARQALPPSALLDMFWPLFGVGVVVGALLSSRISLSGDLRYWLAGCYVVQALAVSVSIFIPTLAGFGLSSLLLGLPFTAITFFAMQEVRRLRPRTAHAYMGLLTVMFGLGQIAGPPLVAFLLRRASSLAAGFALSLEIAAASLLLGAVVYAAMVRVWPVWRGG